MNTLPTADGLRAAHAPRSTKCTLMHSRAVAPRQAGAAGRGAVGRAGGWLTVLAAALTLAACGGGGGSAGGTNPPPPPDPVDAVLTIDSTTPADAAAGVLVGDPLSAAWTVAKGTYDSASATLTCDGAAVAGTWTPGSTGGTLTPAADLARGASCSWEVTVTANGENGGKSATANRSVAFQTEAPVVDTYWNPPPSFTPPGVKVFGANQLPVGCNSAAEQCWKDAVGSGLVKFVSTPATMTGYNSRPVVFAYFRNTTAQFGVVGLWNVLPMYADDGSLVGGDIFGGGSQEEDWVYATSAGVISHQKSTGTCVELYWYSAGSTWSSRPVACPF